MVESTANGNILVEFEMLVDLDYGLVRLVRDYYRDERIFYLSILDKSDKLIKGILKDRTMQNPLQVLFRDESKVELMDNLYKQLLDKHYEEIIQRSCTTAILTLMKRLIDSESSISVNVLCHNKYQEEKTKQIFSDCLSTSYNIHTVDILKGFDLSNYGDIFCRTCIYFPYYINFYGKNIFLSDQNNNFDQDVIIKKQIKIPNKEFLLFLEANQYRIIELYPYDNSYFPNRDYIEEKEDDEDKY